MAPDAKTVSFAIRLPKPRPSVQQRVLRPQRSISGAFSVVEYFPERFLEYNLCADEYKGVVTGLDLVPELLGVGVSIHHTSIAAFNTIDTADLNIL